MTHPPRLDDITGQRTLTHAEATEFARTRVRALVESHPGYTPTYTQGGRWVLDPDPWAPTWSGGFLAGMLWLFARDTEEQWWIELAREYTLHLEPRKSDPTTHDIGFILEPSFGRWYDWTNDSHCREVLIAGGRTMAARLQQPGGYLSTWVDPSSTFIDIMMNVGIIFRAAEYASDRSLYDIALQHTRTTIQHLVRIDGSTVHEGRFDTTTGAFLRPATHQGWRPGSTWARGQAWAIYGFATAYRYTGEPDLLDTGRRVADYYIAHSPAHGIPPNDWDDPHPALPYESSAACIAAAGMLHLADCLTDRDQASRYRTYALRTLATLRNTTFIAADTPGWEGIIRHATYHRRNNIGVDESVMWGDYYFVEALALAARLAPSSQDPV